MRIVNTHLQVYLPMAFNSQSRFILLSLCREREVQHHRPRLKTLPHPARTWGDRGRVGQNKQTNKRIDCPGHQGSTTRLKKKERKKKIALLGSYILQQLFFGFLCVLSLLCARQCRRFGCLGWGSRRAPRKNNNLHNESLSLSPLAY